jgi:transcriptional regulator with XRE-family HTH domain
MPPDLAKVSLGRRLCLDGGGRRLRTQGRVSLRELAGAIGVDPATLWRWENGTAAPRAAAAVRWVDALRDLALSPDEAS